MDKSAKGPFWLVWNPNGRAPTHRHANVDLANAEAARLARNHHGETFIVLQAVHGFRTSPPPVETVSLANFSVADTIPF